MRLSKASNYHRRISADGYNNVQDTGVLHLDSFINGEECNEVIGEIDGHGRWFDWELNL